MNPKIILETGTHWGFSAACMALALYDNGIDYPQNQGYLVSIDHLAYDQKPERLWESIGVDHLVYHFIADSRTVEPVPDNIDFLWLDSDHRPAWFIAEFEHFFPYLNTRGAWIGLHDTRLDAGMSDGVDQLLQLPQIATRYTFQHVQFRNFRGLDLIQFLPRER
jgi:cephalosporin hydroxylase